MSTPSPACTLNVTGHEFYEQDVYHCFSCGLCPGAGDDGADLGVCYACASRCHAGHTVVHAGRVPLFYCDCGVRGCSMPTVPIAFLEPTEIPKGLNLASES